MVAVVLASILGLVTLGALIAAFFASSARGAEPVSDRTSMLGLSLLAGLMAGGTLLVSSVTTVSANTVAVVTEFGRYQGTLDSGLHLIAPWSDTEEFGTRIQPLTMDDTPIRFEGNSGGSADLLIEWRIDTSREDQIERLWRDYRTFDAVQNRLVRSNTRTSLNVELANYTPSEGVSGATLPQITEASRDRLRDVLAPVGIVVERVTIQQINPDRQSQDRINRQVQAQADLERTETTQQIAEREAAIAATRQRAQTPEALQYECLRIVADWKQDMQGPIPTTFNCAFGASGAPVIVGR